MEELTYNLLDFGYVELPKEINTLINNKVIEDSKLNQAIELYKRGRLEIKSNCSCISIEGYKLKEEGLILSLIIHSKSDFVVINEKKLYLWEIITNSLVGSEEKRLLTTLNIRFL